MKIVQSMVRSLRLHGDYFYEESRRNKNIRTRGEYVDGVYGKDKQRWKAQQPLGRLGQVANQMTAMLQAHHWPTTRPFANLQRTPTSSSPQPRETHGTFPTRSAEERRLLQRWQPPPLTSAARSASRIFPAPKCFTMLFSTKGASLCAALVGPTLVHAITLDVTDDGECTSTTFNSLANI